MLYPVSRVDRWMVDADLFGRRRITIELTTTRQVASLKKWGPGLFGMAYQGMARVIVLRECGHGYCCGQLPGAEIVEQFLCDMYFLRREEFPIL